MGSEGVLYRDKIKVPWKFFLLFALPIAVQLFAFTAAALSDKPVPLPVFFILLATILFLTLIALLFSVLRITVTKNEVIVQYGLFGPRIALSDITDCKAVTYDWKTYGGWGIRRGWDGSWAYNMVGDAGRAVRIEHTDAKGKKRVTLVASPNPEALARAVQQARGAETPKLRVAKEPNLAEFEAEAEAEAEAILAEEQGKKRGSAQDASRAPRS